MNSPAETRYVVVTGASSGIGRATALRLAQRNVHVFAGVRREEDGEHLKVEAPERITPIMIDVANEATISAAAATVTTSVGERGLQGLVNNAGISVPGPLEFLPLDDLRRQLEVNVVGQIAVTQAFMLLIRQGHGRIVNVGSIGGRMATPFLGPYNASKFAIEALTDSLRMELQPWGIHVAVVEPGAIDTRIWEKGQQAANEIEAEMPEEARRLYGKAMDAMRKAAKESEERGITPEEVAKAISHALFSKKPKTRYVIGNDARVQALLSRVAPDPVKDRIVNWRLGLPRDAEQPRGS